MTACVEGFARQAHYKTRSLISAAQVTRPQAQTSARDVVTVALSLGTWFYSVPNRNVDYLGRGNPKPAVTENARFLIDLLSPESLMSINP